MSYVFVMPEALKAASEFFGHPISRATVRSKIKTQPIPQYRRFVAAFCRHRGYSFPQIAQFINCANHTSVMYHCEKAAEIWGQNQTFRALMARAQFQSGGYEIHRPSAELIDVIGMNNLARAVAGEWA